MTEIPVSVTESGPQPTPSRVIYSNLINLVSKSVPGYTANLPPALVTDLASTATGAITLLDHAMVDLINSVTPYGANQKVLQELGVIYGVSQGVASNTSVYVKFTGSPGFVIPKGFTVSDGNNSYRTQVSYTIPASGVTVPVYCLAVKSGSWAVPAGTVKVIVTSVPASISLTCINVAEGLPGLPGQTLADYRAQVMQAGMAAVQGTPDYFRTLLQKIPGVQPRLVSFRQVTNDRWVAVVGGGEPFAVGNAIFQSVPDISRLTVDVIDQYGVKPDSVTVTLADYPDSYTVSFIVPDSEKVQVILVWNTTAINVVDPAAIANASTNAIVNYINSIPVGKPINIYSLQQVFVSSLSGTLPDNLISLIDIEVAINGVLTPPDPHSGLITGGYYSYFSTDASNVVVQQYE